ncbi:MAG: ribosome silencing factor [Dehalococcoidia bacterium]|nr:ribosome silencing factor [Dehalococcoidia bacterium]
MKRTLLHIFGGYLLDSRETAEKAVEAASDKQASDIVVLHTQEVCTFADYFVICSGESTRQIEAICDNITDMLKKSGVTIHHSEGSQGSGWLLLDFGDVIVHVFAPRERGYYQLDRLWENAPLVVRLQ